MECAHLDVDANPAGPWAQMSDARVRLAVSKIAGKCHGVVAAANPKLLRFGDYLDALTYHWQDFKIKVEDEAQKYGFTPCEDVAREPRENHPKLAILALTLNGSFVLLGNGCLTPAGSSGRYEKIPLRIGHGTPENRSRPRGVCCTGLPKIGASIDIAGLALTTSPAYLLYVTTRDLPRDDALRLCDSLSNSWTQFSHSAGTLTEFAAPPGRDPAVPPPENVPMMAVR